MHIHVVCWNREHSLRPSFTTSKQILTSIQNSEFSQTALWNDASRLKQLLSFESSIDSAQGNIDNKEYHHMY